MRLIFMGTPDFAAEGLKALLGAGHEISLVLTQPDRPRGRHSAPRKSEVRLLAEEHGISVLTPSRLFTDEEAIGRIRELSPELIVVSAFGQLLPKEVLEIPDYGCVNIHASLLPRFRGASPVQWAILSGDKESGVTTMQMDEGLDTGDILLQESVPLAKDETGGSLFEKLSKLGGKLILETIDGLERGTIQRRRQPEEGALRVGLLKKSSGLLNWNEPSDRLERRIRALNPWPGSFSYLLGKQLKLWKADSLPGAVMRESFPGSEDWMKSASCRRRRERSFPGRIFSFGGMRESFISRRDETISSSDAGRDFSGSSSFRRREEGEWMPPPSSGAEGSFPFKLLSSLRTRVGIGRAAAMIFERMEPDRSFLTVRANGTGASPP